MKDESYWWYIILQAKAELEEVFYYLAQASGSIGSEISIDQDDIRAKLYYRSDKGIDEWVERVLPLIEGFKGISVCGTGKEEWQPWLKWHKEAFPPLEVGKRLVVLAPWHKDEVPSGRIPIYIEPGSAFGTGYHASTQIALELLERHLKPESRVLDVGTGSGILAIAALKLGASSVVARDLDPAVAEEVRKNAMLNDITSGLKLEIADGTKGFDDTVDLVIANILYEPLVSMLDSFKRVLDEDGLIILSGLLFKERDPFVSEMGRSGFYAVEELVKEDWWGVVASCKAR